MLRKGLVMKKSLKKEQVNLLRFEKQLLALGAGLGTLTAVNGAKAEALVGGVASEQAETVRQAYLQLVESVQAAHTALETQALEIGVDIMRAGGEPKEPPLLEMARSVLGLG